MNQMMVGVFTCKDDIHPPNVILKADIVRARVRTFGVEEHKFVMENGMPGVDDRSVGIPA
jgi:hypothetical protein